MVASSYAGAESIRTSHATDEDVCCRSIDSIARRERNWCNSLRVRCFARCLGNSSGTCSGNIYDDGRTVCLVPQHSSNCRNILGDQRRLGGHSRPPTLERWPLLPSGSNRLASGHCDRFRAPLKRLLEVSSFREISSFTPKCPTTAHCRKGFKGVWAEMGSGYGEGERAVGLWEPTSQIRDVERPATAKAKGKSNGKRRSRFPSGMTERKAKARAKAIARATADPYGMTDRKATATAGAGVRRSGCGGRCPGWRLGWAWRGG